MPAIHQQVLLVSGAATFDTLVGVRVIGQQQQTGNVTYSTDF